MITPAPINPGVPVETTERSPRIRSTGVPQRCLGSGGELPLLKLMGGGSELVLHVCEVETFEKDGFGDWGDLGRDHVGKGQRE